MHGILTKRERFLGQSTFDCLADMSELPVTRLSRFEPAALLADAHVASSFIKKQLPTVESFLEFARLANTDAIGLAHIVNQSPDEWRSFFENLSRRMFLTRPARSDPVIRLLRDHWTWKWIETLAIYDKLIRNDTGDLTLGFYEIFAPSLWLCTLACSADQSDCVLLGPIKNKALSVQKFSEQLRHFIYQAERTCTELLPPIHAPSRYEQFYHERPAIYGEDLGRQCTNVVRSWNAISSIVWPAEHTVDYYDVTAATEFAFLMSGPLRQVMSDAARSHGKEISVSYQYPSFLQPGSNRARQLVYLAWGARDNEPIQVSFGYNLSHASGKAISCSNASADLTESVNEEFEKLFRRRRNSQAQRLYEEVLILRNRLTDSFGKLTAQGNEFHGGITEEIENLVGKQITRMAAEGCNAQSAILYKYDHRNSNLFAVGAYIDGPDKTAITRGDYTWMEEIGISENLRLRKESVSYTAVDRDESVEYNESNDFVPLLYRNSTMARPPGSRLIAGKAIISVPIKVFGRLWGVFEVISSRVNSFSYVHVEWMQKVADLVGPYYHEQFIINMLYKQIAVPTVAGSLDRDKLFYALAERAADIFLTEGACMWVRDPFGTDEFNCWGFTGRPDLERLRKKSGWPPSLARGKGGSVALDVVQEKKIWGAGRIGEGRFAGPWLEKVYTRELLSEGYKYIAITPVYDLENTAIAVISIYSKKHRFSSNWESWAQFFSRYVGAVISRVYNAKEVEWGERRLVAHEVSNAVRIARAAANKLSNLVKQLPPDNNAFMWLSDIRTHLHDIEAGVAGWASDEGGTARKKRETVLLETALERAVNQPADEISFRDALNTCVQSLRSEMRKKNIDLHVNYPNRSLLVRIHKENLRMILNNLVSNAVKYSAAGATIDCGTREQTYSISFYIKNFAAPLGEDESLRIFDFGFRGANARDGKVHGGGLGLYIVKKLCDFYKIGVSYRATVARDKRGNVWHQFNLDFSYDMVIDDNNEWLS